MKSSRFTKFISIVLTLALLLQIAPLQAFATTDETVPPEEVVEAAEITAPAAGVVGEVDDLRSEDGKHFRLSDGSLLSVSYGMPVHYTDENGQWQDIDNTLTFQQGADSYVTAENGEAVTAFSADLSKGHLATAAWGDTSVSMGLMQPSQLRSILADPEEDAADAVSPNGEPLLQPDYNTDAAVEVEAAPATMSLSQEDGWKAEDLMPEKLSSTVLYRDVYPGVDLRYTAFSYNLKEQIIVREKQDSYRYDFLLELKGLTAKMQEDGSVVLRDSEGNAVYGIPAPYMEDAKGASSTAVSYTIQEVENGIVLTVTADPEWINSAAFPVTIDPTLWAEVRRSNTDEKADMHATYVIQGHPETVMGKPQDIYLGYGAFNDAHEQWGFFHVRVLPQIPSGSVVIGGSYNLYSYRMDLDEDWGYSHDGCPELPLELCEVTGAKPSSYASYYDWFKNMSWNNKPAVNEKNVIDYTVISESSQGNYVGWDMTRLVKKWYAEGTENRTFAILPSDRGTYSNSRCALGNFMAYSGINTPLFVVNYRNNVGIEPYYTYNTMGAGHAGTAYLADATGQLKVVKEVASCASTANPFSVNLVYNSDYFVNRTSTYLPHGSAMDFGSGWTLDCVQTLASQTIGGREYLRYTDGDGTEHYFTKDSSKDSSYYYDEDGLGLKIKTVTGGYGTYTYEYDSKHNLTSVTDGHVTQNMTYSVQGNVTNTSLKGGSLTMTSSAQYDANGNRLLSVTDNTGATVEYAYSGELSKMLALPESVTDALGNTTTNIYDNFGRITGTSLANGSGVVYTYTKGQLSELSRRTGSTTQNYSFAYNSFGRMTELKVGSRTLARYTYAIGNGDLTKQTYGNEASVVFTYDQQDRVTTRTTSDGKTRTYRYNEDSRLSSVTDSDGRTIQYLYDGLDRLTKCTVLQDGKEILSTGQSYNLAGQVTKQSWTIDGKTYSQEYTYQTASGSLPEGLLTSMTTGSGETLTFSYDSLGRLTGVSSGKTSQKYQYLNNADGTATTRVSTYTASFGGKSLLQSSFTYDAAGNITEEKSNTGVWKYTYDTQGQLTKATNGSATYTFTYDDAGNILTASDGSQTHTYTYGDSSWKDLLTAYDGHAISYDGSGNPTTYYNGRDWTFGWTGGRTLSSASSSSDTGESSIGYTYDLDGIRTGKTVTERVYHTHAYTETKTVAPTCTEQGYTLHQCACGDSYKTDFVSALGHNFEFTKTEKPTCTTSGYTLETCTKCGATQKINFVAALGHIWVKNKLTNTMKCSRCGAVEEGIPVPTVPTKPDEVMDAGEGSDETLPSVVDEEEGYSVSTQSADRILESEATVSYSYIYADGQLLQEKVTTNGATETHNFFYDSTGKPYAMQVNGTTYYYVTNLQGDVMGLVDTNGNTVATYTYDPYGKVLTATGALAEKNPLRYRGYYYDSESSLYYLQSRYYDPATRRFVNADAFASTGQGIIGTNMFAYCNNSPGNSSDPYGYGSISIGGTSQDSFCELLDGGCSGGGAGLLIGIGFLERFTNAVKAVAAKADEEFEAVRDKVAASFAKAESVGPYRSNEEFHHIVAQNDRRAIPAATILNMIYPNGVNDEANIVPIKTSLHRRLHSNAYYIAVNFLIVSAYDLANGDVDQQRLNVQNTLNAIKTVLLGMSAMAP